MKKIYHKKINSTTNISVWKVNWGLEKLRNIYSLEEKKKLKLFTFKSQKREIEVLAEHFILQQLFKKKSETSTSTLWKTIYQKCFSFINIS
ncbi:MAG: hypothetical protein CMP57_03600 [Flavobacteriales bacterium]|nr:hypothetical protein [Flavobacteriales bacterium]